MNTKQQLIELIEGNSDNLVAIQCVDTQENTTFSVQEVSSLTYVSETQYDVLIELDVILRQDLVACEVELIEGTFVVKLLGSVTFADFYDVVLEADGDKYTISHPDLGERILLNIDCKQASHHLKLSLVQFAEISATHEALATNLFLAVFKEQQEKKVLLLGFIPVLPLAITPLDKGKRQTITALFEELE
jgi:hypothetical protein